MPKGVGGSGGRLVDGRLVLDLERHVPYFFTHISNRLSRGASRTYLKHFGIGITEWRVMGVLAGEPDLSANQVSQAVGLDKAAVSRSLQVLVRKEIVRTTDDPTDNRSRTLALTASGLALHDRIIAVAFERERLLLECLTEEQREAFIIALRRLREQVRTVNAYDPGPDA
jgi:DNA-binding MarR family transcriptional regulator